MDCISRSDRKQVSKMTKVFIDGKEGTTGLQIWERLADRDDLELLVLPEELRKDSAARKEALNSCDIAFFCLPDAAAREAAAMIENPAVRVIDASTAHRTAPGWTYGFPELSNDIRKSVETASRVANPGCHASGFIALIRPLVDAGLLAKDTALSSFSITGYSGGGKGMIAGYENADRDSLLDAPRQYGLSQNHKHLPEMQTLCGLSEAPVFCPIVSDYYCGMEVTVPLFAGMLRGSAADVRNTYAALYTGPIVHYTESADEVGFLSAGKYAAWDGMEISVHGNDERILLCARYDNLGKGASGAAVQSFNIMTGQPETKGLRLNG